jgi:formylmethanofuran dehydrogenase subunit E
LKTEYFRNRPKTYFLFYKGESFMFTRNCKVRCIGYNAFERYFTIGNIYQVIDNKITCDMGHTYNGNELLYGSNRNIVDWLKPWYRFELVEHSATKCDFCGKDITDEECKILDGDIYCNECFEEKTVFCDCCGRIVNEDNTEYVNGEYVCTDCVERHYFTCDCCGELVHRYNRVYAEGETICESCANEYYVECNDCGELIHTDNAYFDERTEEYYCCSCWEDRKNRVINGYHYKPVPIFYGTGIFKMGIELEVDEGGEYEDNAEVLLNIANADTEHIYIKHDGSLEEGFEIVSHPATLDYHINEMPWKDIMEKAVKMGYRSHNTDTCGLHVHVSRKALGNTWEERDETISKILYFTEKNWNEIVRFTRRTDENLNHWACRYGIEETPKATFDKAKNDFNRYRCINLLNDNTIEFRMFRGTLKHSTFVATLQLVYLICDVCKNADVAEMDDLTWETFVNSINSEKYPEFMEYIKIRGLNV